mmetsp:Transcript_100984/g.231618  ORF Transcript_100984/g.231618 Transcript_100984/m.231618 type:complete len:252 (+) Transcript_100984:188-943(+)
MLQKPFLAMRAQSVCKHEILHSGDDSPGSKLEVYPCIIGNPNAQLVVGSKCFTLRRIVLNGADVIRFVEAFRLAIAQLRVWPLRSRPHRLRGTTAHRLRRRPDRSRPNRVRSAARGQPALPHPTDPTTTLRNKRHVTLGHPARPCATLGLKPAISNKRHVTLDNQGPRSLHCKHRGLRSGWRRGRLPRAGREWARPGSRPWENRGTQRLCRRADVPGSAEADASALQRVAGASTPAVGIAPLYRSSAQGLP